jgi:two-component system, cell cycle sensor histidine kinase and response regulator CckA
MIQSSAGRRAVLLLVEDEDQIRTLIRSVLAGENVTIMEASNGAEGLRIAQKSPVPVDILLTDMLLPELSGYDLAVALREMYPNMKIIMVTGYVEGDIVQRGIEELHAAFLDKPFKASELRRLVAEAASGLNSTSTQA